MPKKSAKKSNDFRDKLPEFSTVVKEVESTIKKDPVKSALAAFGLGVLFGSLLGRGRRKGGKE